LNPLSKNAISHVARHSDAVLAMAVVGVLLVLMLPIPTWLIDILLSMNISVSLLLLLLAISVGESVTLSAFPSLLLFTTLFRLSLNVATTRLILMDGDAGAVVRAFGKFVAGNNLVVGIVVFMVLMIIQLIVITKGSVRIGEVAARFTLDAMPGKQMSIDADLNSGLIDENEARRRRERITREAEFYGAMDGASRFVRGDATAGIIITFINLIGGVIMGKSHGMSMAEAAETYAILTIGDGLVSQIPALLISTTGGLIVTKASSKESISRDLAHQMLMQPRPLALACGILLGFSLIPGLPFMPFLVLSGIMGGLFLLTRDGALATAFGAAEEPADAGAQAAHASPAKRELEEAEISRALHVDRMSIEVGFRLIPLVDPGQDDEMLRKIGALRKQIAKQLGIVIPPIHIRDNLHIRPDEYVIRIRGDIVARGELLADHVLAMDSGTVTARLHGKETTEPAFGLPALWLVATQREEAEACGYTVADPRSVLITHLSEVIKKHAHEILSREDIRQLIDAVRGHSPTVVEELIPNIMNLGGVQRILQNLLRERVPVSDLVTILEAISDHAGPGPVKDYEALTEHVRRAMARTIGSQIVGRGSRVGALQLDPAVERLIAQSLRETPTGVCVALDPAIAENLFQRVTEAVRDTVASGFEPILVTSASVRRHVRSLLEHIAPDLWVVSYDELSPDLRLEGRGMISLAEAEAAA